MSGRIRKRYWRSQAERDSRAASADARPGASAGDLAALDKSMDRRSFLKAAGFLFGAGAVSGCSRSPVFKAIPHLIAPEEVVPGKALWYATTCGACSAACGALVKVREGRPIKLEGTPSHPLSQGGLCALGQASVLELYDSRRLKGPLLGGASASWSEADSVVTAALREARSGRRSVRVLTGTVNSPTLERSISGLLAGLPDARHVSYDALSSSAILDAHERTHGRRVLPRYRFDEAEVIVGIDADFLGTWISPVEHSASWRKRRVPVGTPPRMSFHAQFESRMSLTGANADRRILLPIGAEGLLAAHLAQALARRAKASAPYDALPPCPVGHGELDGLADRLWAARERGLVVCGANELAAQAAVNHANELLGAYGTTLDIRRPSFQRRGSDAALAGLLAELRAGTVGVLIVHGCNPAAELPVPAAGLSAAGTAREENGPRAAPGESWEALLSRAGLLVTTSTHLDETSRLAGAVCPDHHFLESWSDAEPAAGTASVTQPVIRPLGDTRSAIESFAAWAGKPAPMRELVRETWRRIHPRAQRGGAFEDFWTNTVHEGWTALEAPAVDGVRFNGGALRSLKPAEPVGPGLSLLLYPKIGMREGRHAQNPWLQELPDPVTKVVWDNYASFSPAAARGLGLSQGDIVRLSAAGASIELPAFIQPGQEDGAVCVALGYGRAGTERFFDLGPDWIQGRRTVSKGGRVGANAAPFLSFVDGRLAYSFGPVSVEKTGGTWPLACTQEYHSLQVPERLAETPGEERDIVRETTLAEYARSPSAGHAPQHPATSLWPASLAPGGRRWAMTVDLSLCTGCSSCVLACQAENNVAVVGKDEVARRRDMHWMRIDRYYSDSEEGVETLHQPMFCQQCGNAPCETVCPVIATAGSEDGLNQQVYNRCVGTRYCANNCPYKVRRFNWFEYRRADAPENLVLNPDVTIRSRGVMEKCSFCVQRIQEAKIEAKRLGAPLREGDLRTACQQSCPTQAIAFGDVHDKESRVAERMNDPRRYRVLEELHVNPAVGYLTKVRNKPA